MQGPPLDPTVLAPAAFPALGALVVLVADAALARRPASELRTTLLAGVAALFVGLSFYTALLSFRSGIQGVFNPALPMFQLDSLSSFALSLLCGAALLVIALSSVYLPAIRSHLGEYYALLLLSLAGACVLVCAIDLLLVYLAIELMTIPVHALAAYDRAKLRSSESALKHFLASGLASAVLLYGMVLIYGATGHTGFVGVREGFAAGGSLALAGLALLISGLAAKLAVVPFHPWAADLYEGAPRSVGAFLALVLQVAVGILLLRVVMLALPSDVPRLADLFAALAVVTMVVGSAMAVLQQSLVRMLAYVAVSQLGHLLMALAAGTAEAYGALLFYLVGWVFALGGAFAVVVALVQGGRERDRIEDLAGLSERRPGLAFLLLLFALSLAGLPGTAGFMGRFYVFSSAVAAGQPLLAAVAVATSVVVLIAFARLAVTLYMREPAERGGGRTTAAELAVLAVCAASVVYLGLLPNDRWLLPSVRALDLARAAIVGLSG